jgi:hypothetical protein
LTRGTYDYPEGNPVLLSAIFVGLGILVIISVAAAVQMRKQRGALEDWAATRGWTYTQGGGGPWLQYLPRGDAGRGVWHQLHGARDGHRVTVADYYYATASTNSDAYAGSRTTTTSHGLTVVVVGLTAGHPPVELRERVFGKFGAAVAKAAGPPAKNLTGVEEFDRRYRVHAQSEATALLTPRVVRATLNGSLPAWQVRGDQLIIPWPSRMRADDLDSRITRALALAAVLDSSDTRA